MRSDKIGVLYLFAVLYFNGVLCEKWCFTFFTLNEARPRNKIDVIYENATAPI